MNCEIVFCIYFLLLTNTSKWKKSNGRQNRGGRVTLQMRSDIGVTCIAVRDSVVRPLSSKARLKAARSRELFTIQKGLAASAVSLCTTSRHPPPRQLQHLEEVKVEAGGHHAQPDFSVLPDNDNDK